jgi:predicted nucleotidyltransferase
MEVTMITQSLISVLNILEGRMPFELYLFGSVLVTTNFHDIDILVVYELEGHSQIIKDTIENQLPDSLIHFTCLTVDEERELDFVRITKALKVAAE